MPNEYTTFDKMKLTCPKCKDRDSLSQTILLSKSYKEGFVRVLYWCQNCGFRASENWQIEMDSERLKYFPYTDKEKL